VFRMLNKQTLSHFSARESGAMRSMARATQRAAETETDMGCGDGGEEGERTRAMSRVRVTAFKIHKRARSDFRHHSARCSHTAPALAY
jgi:hypothetical protein